MIGDLLACLNVFFFLKCKADRGPEFRENVGLLAKSPGAEAPRVETACAHRNLVSNRPEPCCQQSMRRLRESGAAKAGQEAGSPARRGAPTGTPSEAGCYKCWKSWGGGDTAH